MDNKKHNQVPATKSSKNAKTQNWQAKHNTTMGSLDFLLFNRIMSDITFLVGSEQVHIPAHKFILSIRSNVFHTMFYGTSCEALELEIPDIEPSAFRNLLKYLYTDNVEIRPESLITTLYTAKKYDIPALEKRCENLLADSLCTENAFLLLTQARFFHVSHLISSCLDMIDRYTQACLDATCFLDIDYDTLKVVVCRDTLRIKEIFLYEAVKRWSEAKCEHHDLPVTSHNQKWVLKDLVKLIRYPLMSNQEFALGPAEDDLLTDKEVALVFLHINGNPKPGCKFLNKPRSLIRTTEIVCNRFGKDPYESYYSSESKNSIGFSVNQRIFVSGFGLIGTRYSCQLEVDMELIRIDNDTVIASHTTTFLSGGSTNPYKVFFKKPVEVMAHTNYRAVANMQNNKKFYVKTDELNNATVTCEDGQNVTFQFFNSNSENNSQFAQILFYPQSD